ncbi:MAG: response regulator transcription factor [Candidatus Eremiobacteraeota bacterium]|nr:response regulator transcription factor [Candidatus Eremiobacteraeota bacterium]
MLELNLELRGFTVRCAADGMQAFSLAREWHPDVIVLDVMLPKVDGLSLLPALRNITEAPIVMLSARGEVEDKVRGLARGADDYVSKPFEMAELIARLGSALRRPRLARRSLLTCADLTLDLEEHSVMRGGQRLELTALEFKLLATLLRSPSRVFTRDELFASIWGDDRDAEYGSVGRTISYLRAKVDRGFDLPLIHTIRGVGYTVRA